MQHERRRVSVLASVSRCEDTSGNHSTRVQARKGLLPNVTSSQLSRYTYDLLRHRGICFQRRGAAFRLGFSLPASTSPWLRRAAASYSASARRRHVGQPKLPFMTGSALDRFRQCPKAHPKPIRSPLRKEDLSEPGTVTKGIDRPKVATPRKPLPLHRRPEGLCCSGRPEPEGPRGPESPLEAAVR